MIDVDDGARDYYDGDWVVVGLVTHTAIFVKQK